MKKTIRNFKSMKRKGEPICWVTAYDYPLALCAERAGVDMILVGDSGGMVQLGYETTNSVSMEEMLVMAKAARRGAPNTFLIGDLPQGSYEVSDADAVINALRYIKEASCDAVKLEGGKRILPRVRAIVDAGILVIGHLGLTPQSTQSFGGYRVQGKTRLSFENILKDAFALQKAGVCAILLEAMPDESAHQIAKQLSVPVLGIGAGTHVDGQLLIIHDLLGLYDPFRPKFAKCYIGEVIENYNSFLSQHENIRQMGVETRKDGLLTLVQYALEKYVAEVKSLQFPGEDYEYTLTESSLDSLKRSEMWQE